MVLGIVSEEIYKKKIDTLIIPVMEDDEIYTDALIKGLIGNAHKTGDFKKKYKETLTLYQSEDIEAKRIIFLGLGKKDKINLDKCRDAIGSVIRKCIKLKVSSANIVVPQKTKTAKTVSVPNMMEGAFLANYLFDKYKEKKKFTLLKNINFVVAKDEVIQLKKLINEVQTKCEGTFIARDWVSTPANDLTVSHFSKQISDLASKENIKCTILDEKYLKKNGFNALLAVGKGSAEKPKLVIMEYKPSKATKKIALVGKAVMFDSGGLSLKPGSSMEDMKVDMAGGAAVASTIITAARLKLDAHIVAAIPMVENMPSGTATKPGDIVKCYNGKTVEILNTDAEGRLIMADTLAYMVEKYNPQTIVDVATLTGACMVALGEHIAGVFSNNEEKLDALMDSSKSTDERCWKMPLPDDYNKLLKSSIADLRNISTTRYGGSITAALFLQNFVSQSDWIHIDIAGPAHISKPTSYCPAGGTGFGVRLLVDFLMR